MRASDYHLPPSAIDPNRIIATGSSTDGPSTLLLGNHFAIRSDGDWDNEWADGARIGYWAPDPS